MFLSRVRKKKDLETGRRSGGGIRTSRERGRRGEGDRERGREVSCDLVGLRYTYSTMQFQLFLSLYHVVSFHISSDCLTDI